MTLPFRLPRIEGLKELPVWDGTNFRVGNVETPVLEYSENLEGWSDDLTTLHEEVSGANHPMDLASRKNAIVRVREALKSPTGSVLEIGCSSGFLLEDLVREFPEARIIGADVVRTPLFSLAKRLPGVPLLRFDLLRCPLEEQIVDVVVMLNVLEHIEHDVEALRKAYALLRPGGSIVLEVPAGPRLYDSYDAELRHFRRYSSFELRKKLRAAGFRIARRSHIGFLLMLPFAVVKLANKWRGSRPKGTAVRSQARETSKSPLVRLAMGIESRYLAKFSLPFGIRICAVATRPLQ